MFKEIFQLNAQEASAIRLSVQLPQVTSTVAPDLVVHVNENES